MWNCRMGDLKEYLKILGICYSYNQNLQIEKKFFKNNRKYGGGKCGE